MGCRVCQYHIILEKMLTSVVGDLESAAVRQQLECAQRVMEAMKQHEEENAGAAGGPAPHPEQEQVGRLSDAHCGMRTHSLAACLELVCRVAALWCHVEGSTTVGSNFGACGRLHGNILFAASRSVDMLLFFAVHPENMGTSEEHRTKQTAHHLQLLALSCISSPS